jgi:MoaA/NifB/PqqE/SkfB family radical SAM enzyme
MSTPGRNIRFASGKFMLAEFRENLVIKIKTVLLMLRLIPNARVFLRLVRGYLRVNLLGREQLRFVELFVTLACNARCEFCSNGLFTEKKGTLGYDRYLSLIDECAELDVPLVCLIGGEPLLYDRIEELVERIHRRGMMSMIATNGRLLTEERVRDLAVAGLTNVTASLFSLDEARHDAVLKLPGTFRRIFEARDYCRSYGISFSLATVVGHDDFENGNFEQLVEFAENEKVPLSINPLIPTGFGQRQLTNLLTPADRARLDEVAKRSVFVSTHLTNNYFGFGCPAGNSYLGVNATGEIFPCFFFPVSLGNASEMTLAEAWRRACRSPLFTRRHKMCYAGVSPEFISRYPDPIFEGTQVPIPLENHPLYDSAHDCLPDLETCENNQATPPRNDDD